MVHDWTGVPNQLSSTNQGQEWRHALALVLRPGSVADMALLRRDPRHPSLHFKKVGKFWSARTARSVSRCPTVYSGSGSEPTQNTIAGSALFVCAAPIDSARMQSSVPQ